MLSKSFSGGAYGTRTVDLNYNTGDRLYRYGDTDTTNGAYRYVFYDARGNVTNNGRQTFEYDYANQPTAANLGGVTASFAYDGSETVKKMGMGPHFQVEQARLVGEATAVAFCAFI